MRRIQTSLFASALGFTLSLLVLPGASAFTIVIDDRSESPFVVIDGTPTAFNDGEILPIVATIPGVFSAVNVRFIILDRNTTNVSDILSLAVSPGTGEASGSTSINIEFQSDAESPLRLRPIPTPSLSDQTITETGNFQTVYSSSDLSTQGNPDLVIRFASDVEGTAPEPTILTLLAVAFVAVGWARRQLN